MSNMYSGDFAFGTLYVFMHCLSVCIILRVHSLSKCLSTVINVYNISFLVATPCLRFYSLSKCLVIVFKLVPITCTCLIVFTMSVWSSVSICLSVYTQYLQCLHCVPLSLFVLVSIHCLSVYIVYITYICLFLCKCLFIVSGSTLSTLCTSVSFCLNVYTLSQGLHCLYYMYYLSVFVLWGSRLGNLHDLVSSVPLKATGSSDLCQSLYTV